MCGIYAFIGREDVGRARAAAAVEALRHRGPDGRDTLQRDGVTLGQTRLQIVGGAAAGAQPVADARYAMVFNGEVHNYRALARELQADGVAVDDRSDTAVLFALLRYRGAEGLERVRGFWAVVFVDFERRTVFVSRDRYGQKPLVYAADDAGLAFASEAHALGVPLRPRLDAVREFVVGGHYPAAPDTFFAGVRQVAPGTVVTYGFAGHCTSTVTLGALVAPVQPSAGVGTPETSPVPAPPFEEAVGHFRAKLERACRLRLVADVPVGLMLSAGKDSGTLARLTAATPPRAAFTFDSRDGTDESAEVRQWYGGDFEVHVAQLDYASTDDFAAACRRLHATLDAPLASASLLALDRLHHAARGTGVPVVLSGQGADELLAGYQYYSGLGASPLERAYRRLEATGGWRGAPAALLDLLSARRMTAPFRGGGESSSPAASLGENRVRESAGPRERSALPADAVTRQRHRDLYGARLQTMLWYEDRIAMAHGVEGRFPFLDADLVAYCLRLPGDYFVEGSQRKRLLTAAYGARWPSELQRERVKRGLPAGERRLIEAHGAWFGEGFAYAGHYLGAEVGVPRVVGDRGARAAFRIAAAGHWLRLQDS